MLKQTIIFAAIAGLVFALAPAARAVDIDWVTVGDPGNPARTTGRAATIGYGAVDYEYIVGKYEMTNAQYAEFLNAVAGDDTNNLYNLNMGSDLHGGITQSGTSPNYSYIVKTGESWTMGDKPVNYVSVSDMARFANWLHNGQPTGLQVDATTEDGAYDMDDGDLLKEPGAKYWVPTADEYVKAASYDPRSAAEGGPPEGDNYWEYATMSNGAPPTNDIQAVRTGDPGTIGDGRIGGPGGTTPVTSGNHANYGHPPHNAANWNGSTDGNVTTVGTNGGPSYYGTHDQDGNVMERRLLPNGSYHVAGGGYHRGDGGELLESWDWGGAANEDPTVGFRLAGFVITDVPGDLSGDGDVDDEDADLFFQQFGSQPHAPGPPYTADFDEDDDVDLDDFLVMRNNFGTGVSAPEGGATIPEPATMAVLAIGGMIVLRRRRTST